FETVGTPLIEGRDFNEYDTEGSESVVIISAGLARRIADAGHAVLDSRIRLGGGGWSKVVGVCADARYRDVTKSGPDIFVPYLQAGGTPTNYVVIRGTLSRTDLSA